MSKTAKNFASAVLNQLDATTETMVDVIENSEVVDPLARDASLDDRLKYIIDVLSEHDPDEVGFDQVSVNPYNDTTVGELCNEFDGLLRNVALIDLPELKAADPELLSKYCRIIGPLTDLRDLLRPY